MPDYFYIILCITFFVCIAPLVRKVRKGKKNDYDY